MTEDDFRKIALSLPEATESAHMRHPDFRVGGKIFATLMPEKGWAMVKLTPEDQEAFMQIAPKVFSPVNGAWGRQGATRVHLKSATKTVARDGLTAAWRFRAPKSLVARTDAGK
ncbi:MAG: MmcQ/YjbR family DNA-binding protein [Acidobacteria bacterium]|nr:MmcQ/YjbR family DNA-binding protein [Acidobacteriota bacterium]MCA1609446.1 MmcQ/YjbR family DNA-binding protein [Acidobacteriota bacterium]